MKKYKMLLIPLFTILGMGIQMLGITTVFSSERKLPDPTRIEEKRISIIGKSSAHLQVATDSSNWKEEIKATGSLTGVDLKATSIWARGGQYPMLSYYEDPIMLTYYFDCENDGQWDKIINSRSDGRMNEVIVTDVCDYSSIGSYEPKVRVVRHMGHLLKYPNSVDNKLNNSLTDESFREDKLVIGYSFACEDTASVVIENRYWTGTDLFWGLNGLWRPNYASPTVFEKDGTAYMITGHYDGYGDMYGYRLDGTDWVVDWSIVAGINSAPNTFVTPFVFQMDSMWYLIHGGDSSDYTGYVWAEGDMEWVPNSSIINGLESVDYWKSDPVAFEIDNVWYLISGDAQGGFHGYQRIGNEWVENTNITGGLQEVYQWSAPAVFTLDGKSYLINGEITESWNFALYGYEWNGSEWETNNDIVSGLEGLPSYSATTFVIQGNWYFLASTASRYLYGAIGRGV